MKEFFKKAFSKEGLKSFFKSFVWLMILVFIADIVTKWVFANHFGFVTPSDSEMIKIIPNFLYISLGFNTGMAWSLLAGTGGKIVLAVVSLVLGLALTYYYSKTFKTSSNLTRIALALMITGAFGNFIDRAFYWKGLVGFTGVIDWIQVYFGNYAFPTFNIADSALVIGVALLVVQLIIDAIKESIEKGKAGEYKYSPEELEKQKENKNEEDQSK